MQLMKSNAVKLLLAVLVVLALTVPTAMQAQSKPKFRVGWSIYVGWMPWPYAEESGILKKLADKSGIEIELKELGDGTALDAFVAKQRDAVVRTQP